jgi:O-antigen ligase
LVVILGILTILWTKSAGALIGLTFGLIAWLIFYKKTWIITVITLTIIFIITFSQSGIISYLKNSFNSLIYTDLPLSPSDLQIRYQQWKETLNLLKDTPIFGAGLAGYQTLMVPYHQFWHIEIFLYPHNFFLNFWTETGLLGLISIIWTIATFFIIGYQSTINNQQSTIKTLTLATICAMITLLIHGLVDVPYFKNDLAILFWVIIGIMVTLYQDTRNKFQDINKLQ